MPEAGQNLSHYRLIEKIGEGGMGVVWRAEDTKLRRDVALKFLPEGIARDPERLARFEREARTLASLNHTNVGAIYGFDEGDGLRFLVLELVRGTSLAARVRAQGPLPVAEALRIACEIARGVEAAHARGVIHRDLKPGNVQLTSAGQVKVLDFGLAKTFTEATSEASLSEQATMTLGTGEHVIVGTVPYMSPEQASAMPIDKRTDIWAFGCILYELMAGQRAFSGDSVTDTFAAIHGQSPDWERLPEDTPPEVGRLLKRCLEKDVDRRLRDIGDARIELEDSMSGVSAPTAAIAGDPPSSPGTRQPVFAGRRRLVLAGIIAAIAVVGVVAVMMSRWRDGNSPTASTATDRPGVSIAVLPFVDLSPKGDQEYFGDGVSEELIHKLVKIPQLRVAGRTSSFSFRGKELDLRHIGEVLTVDTILEGSVRKSGDSLRITAQLINAEDGFNIWSETYERTSADIFAVQDDLARRVVEAMRIEFGIDAGQGVGAGSQGTRDREAYELYLQARHLFHYRSTGDTLRRSIELFEQSVSRDTGFARAYAGLAAAWAILPGYERLEPSEDALASAEAAVRRALELDLRLVETHAVTGYIHAVRREWIQAEDSLRRALELEPNNPTALHWFGVVLLLEGRVDEALRRVTQALDVDPASAVINTWLGLCYHAQGNLDAAVTSVQRSVDLGFPSTNYLPVVLTESGQYAAAAEALGLEGDDWGRYGELVDALENPERRSAFVRQIVEGEVNPVDLYRGDISIIQWVMLGEIELALDRLDRVTARDNVVVFDRTVVWHPRAAPMRRHQRFAEWVKKIGLVDAWDQVGWPEACEPAGDGAICH